MRTVTAVGAALSALLFVGCGTDLTPTEQFHKVIERADRIVVRHGGFTCHYPVENVKVLFEVKDPAKVRTVREKLRFTVVLGEGGCACCGYPRIDWYRGTRRLALTSVHHGRRIRWKNFPGDASLTRRSQEWLNTWLRKHNVSGVGRLSVIVGGSKTRSR